MRGIGYLESPEDIKRIVLRSKDGTAVTIGDVATVVQSYTPRRGAVGVGSKKEGIESFIWMRRGQNPSVVLDGIHEKIRELNETILPKGMEIEVYYDRSDLVGLTLSTVHKNLLSGFVLVVGVVWLFLRSVAGSIAVAIVIPLVTAGGVSRPVSARPAGQPDFDGRDRFRHPGGRRGGAGRERNPCSARTTRRRPPRRVARSGRSAVDVGRPTLYAMLIIIAALIPVFTLQSVEGRIFRPLALTYSFALIGALVFALTRRCRRCARRYSARAMPGSKEPGWIERLRAGYRRLSRGCSSAARVVVGAVFVMLALGR